MACASHYRVPTTNKPNYYTWKKSETSFLRKVSFECEMFKVELVKGSNTNNVRVRKPTQLDEIDILSFSHRIQFKNSKRLHFF